MVQHSTRTGFIGQVESPQYGEWKQLKVKIPLALQRSCCEGERISVPPSSFVHHPNECDAVQYEDDCEGCSLTTWRTRCQNRRQLSSQHHHLIQRDAFAGEHILCMVQVTFSRLANRLVVPSWQSTLRLTDHLLPVVSFSTQWLSKYYVCDSTAMWSYRMENTFCHAEAGSESLLAWKQSINNNSATFHKIFELYSGEAIWFPITCVLLTSCFPCHGAFFFLIYFLCALVSSDNLYRTFLGGFK